MEKPESEEDYGAQLRVTRMECDMLRRENAQLRRIAHNAVVVADQERSLRKWRPTSQKKLDRLERKRAT